jgi:hypothetical protein
VDPNFEVNSTPTTKEKIAVKKVILHVSNPSKVD